MSLSDPIGDMLARIKNSQMRNHKKVEIPSSNFKTKIADVLKNEGSIARLKMQPNPIFGPHQIRPCQNRDIRNRITPLNRAGDTPAKIVGAAKRFLRDCVIGYARLLLGLGSV